MYCYAVLIHGIGNPPNVRSGPLLGIHTSMRKAREHVNIIVANRRKREDYKEYWSYGPETLYSTDSPSRRMQRTLVNYKEGGKELTEEIEIERWYL